MTVIYAPEVATAKFGGFIILLRRYSIAKTCCDSYIVAVKKPTHTNYYVTLYQLD